MTQAAMTISSAMLPEAVPVESPHKDWDGGPTRLWGVSGAVMFALHAGVLAAAVLWHPQFKSSAPPPAAMMIELAPMAAPPAPPREMAPGIEQTASRPLEKKVEEELKPPPVKKVEVPLPKPKPKPQAKPQPEAPPAPKVVEQTTAPVAAETPPAPTMAAPAPGASPSPPSNAVPTWQGALRAHLERFKRYPASAQFRRQEGVSTVRFVMDRDGKVLSAQLERGAGHSLLDAESLALLERAQPLPIPPPEIRGDRIELVVPVQFFLK